MRVIDLHPIVWMARLPASVTMQIVGFVMGQVYMSRLQRGILYSQAMESLEAGKDLTPAAIYVCDVCGHTHVGEAPDKCPVCGAAKSKFREVG